MSPESPHVTVTVAADAEAGSIGEGARIRSDASSELIAQSLAGVAGVRSGDALRLLTDPASLAPPVVLLRRWVDDLGDDRCVVTAVDVTGTRAEEVVLNLSGGDILRLAPDMCWPDVLLDRWHDRAGESSPPILPPSEPGGPPMDITIIDATGSKREEATVPGNAAAGRILTKLVELMEMPSVNQNGEAVSYAFYNKRTSKLIPDDVTLEAAGVTDGDTLRLTATIVAG
jgi:hypothetical protein